MPKIEGYKSIVIQLPGYIHARWKREAKRQKLTMGELGELLIETFLESIEEESRKSAPVLRKAARG